MLALPLSFFLLRDEPGEMGLLPDGDLEPSSLEDKSKAQTPVGPLESSRWIDSLKPIPMWQLSGAYFVCGFTANMISMHFVPYAQGEGFSRGTAVTAFGLMSGLNIVGVIITGAVADKLGRKNLLASVYVLRGFAFGMILLAPTTWGLWGFAILAGFSWVATIPLTTSLTADIYGLKTLGTLGGISFLAHQIGGSISVLMAGIIYDATGSYSIPFGICALLLFGAGMVSFSIRERTYSAKYLTQEARQGYTATM